MKLVLIVVLAVASSMALPPPVPKTINISEDGGTIVITTAVGKKITIHPSPNGQKEVIVEGGSWAPIRRFQITNSGASVVPEEASIDQGDDYLRLKRGSSSKPVKSQDALSAIFSEFQGSLDDVSYSKLLKKAEKAVQKGQLAAPVYEALQHLQEEGGAAASWKRPEEVPSTWNRPEELPATLNRPQELPATWNRPQEVPSYNNLWWLEQQQQPQQPYPSYWRSSPWSPNPFPVWRQWPWAQPQPEPYYFY